MEIEAETEEEAIRKARFFLGLNPNLEKALELSDAAKELFLRCADTAPEGAEVSYFLNAALCLKQIIAEAPREISQGYHTDNIVQFSEIYRRPKHGRCRLSSTAESDQET